MRRIACRLCSPGPSSTKLTSLIVPDYATAQAGSAPFFAVVASPESFPLRQRIIHNRDHSSRPWESSCIEVSLEDLRFYFETATPEGLAGYRYVAAAVALGNLPGEMTNMMSAGFGLWKVKRSDYEAMLRAQSGLTDT